MVSKGSNGERKSPTKASPQRLDPFEGKGPTVLPDIGDVTVSSRDPRNPMEYVADTVKEIYAPTHGDNLHVSFVNPALEGGGKVATMLRHGFITLHWSDMTPKQLKQMRAIVQRQPDDLVRYADCVIMLCKEQVFQARRRFLEEESRLRMNAQVRNESAATQSSELGIPVSDKFERDKW